MNRIFEYSFLLETERLGMKSCGSHTVVYRGKEMPHVIYKLVK